MDDGLNDVIKDDILFIHILEEVSKPIIRRILFPSLVVSGIQLEGCQCDALNFTLSAITMWEQNAPWCWPINPCTYTVSSDFCIITLWELNGLWWWWSIMPCTYIVPSVFYIVTLWEKILPLTLSSVFLVQWNRSHCKDNVRKERSTAARTAFSCFKYSRGPCFCWVLLILL